MKHAKDLIRALRKEDDEHAWELYVDNPDEMVVLCDQQTDGRFAHIFTMPWRTFALANPRMMAALIVNQTRQVEPSIMEIAVTVDRDAERSAYPATGQ